MPMLCIETVVKHVLKTTVFNTQNTRHATVADPRWGPWGSRLHPLGPLEFQIIGF